MWARPPNRVHAEDFVFLPAVVFQGCRVYLDDAEIFVESHEAVAEHVENAFGALMDCPHGRLRADLLRHVGSLNGDGCQSALPGPDRLDSKLQDDLAVHPRHGHSQAFGPVADCERLADRVPQSRPCRHRGVVERRAESAAIRQLLETRIGERDFALRPAQDAKKARQLLEKEHRPDRQHIDLRLRRRSAMTGLLEIVVGNAQTLQHAILQAIGAGTGTIHLASLFGKEFALIVDVTLRFNVGFGNGPAACRRSLEAAAVHGHRLELFQIDGIKAPDIDRRRRLAGGFLAFSEGCAATGGAEPMRDRVGVECVGRQVLLAPQDIQGAARHKGER